LRRFGEKTAQSMAGNNLRNLRHLRMTFWLTTPLK
jgi:hypothetical protein